MILFAGCTFCHCTVEKFFLGKGAGAKMLMLGPARKHSFGHENDIYARGWHVPGPDRNHILEMVRLLWVRDIE